MKYEKVTEFYFGDLKIYLKKFPLVLLFCNFIRQRKNGANTFYLNAMLLLRTVVQYRKRTSVLSKDINDDKSSLDK